MEFLVSIETTLPHSLSHEDKERLATAEFERGQELASQGILCAIWRVPGRLANRAIWSAPDATTLHEAITSLPMWPYMQVEVVPLARHNLSAYCSGLPAGPR
jgi:muconolactone D-isomerase